MLDSWEGWVVDELDSACQGHVMECVDHGKEKSCGMV